MKKHFSLLILVSLLCIACGDDKEKNDEQKESAPQKVKIKTVDESGKPIESFANDPKIEEHAIAYCECVETHFGGDMIMSELTQQELATLKLEYGSCISHVKKQIKLNQLDKKAVQEIAEQNCFKAIEKLNIFKVMRKN